MLGYTALGAVESPSLKRLSLVTDIAVKNDIDVTAFAKTAS